MRRHKKGQGWSLDFVAGLLIFLLAVVLSVKLISNAFTDDNFNDVYDDARILSEAFRGEGFPENWDASNVVTIGLTTDGRLNESKIAELYTIPYKETKRLINTPYDYYLYYGNATENLEIQGACGYGMPGAMSWGAGCTNPQLTMNATNLVTIQRLTVHDNNLATITFLVWQR